MCASSIEIKDLCVGIPDLERTESKLFETKRIEAEEHNHTGVSAGESKDSREKETNQKTTTCGDGSLVTNQRRGLVQKRGGKLA